MIGSVLCKRVISKNRLQTRATFSKMSSWVNFEKIWTRTSFGNSRIVVSNFLAFLNFNFFANEFPILMRNKFCFCFYLLERVFLDPKRPLLLPKCWNRFLVQLLVQAVLETFRLINKLVICIISFILLFSKWYNIYRMLEVEKFYHSFISSFAW